MLPHTVNILFWYPTLYHLFKKKLQWINCCLLMLTRMVIWCLHCISLHGQGGSWRLPRMESWTSVWLVARGIPCTYIDIIPDLPVYCLKTACNTIILEFIPILFICLKILVNFCASRHTYNTSLMWNDTLYIPSDFKYTFV